MNLTAYNILIVIAILLAILNLIKPTWPILGVAVLLVCVALLAKTNL